MALLKIGLLKHKYINKRRWHKETKYIVCRVIADRHIGNRLNYGW